MTNLTDMDIEFDAERIRFRVLLPLSLSLFREHNVRVAVFRTAVDLIPLRDRHDETVSGEDIVVRGA